MVHALKCSGEQRALPARLQADKRSEPISTGFVEGCQHRNIRLIHLKPGKAQQSDKKMLWRATCLHRSTVSENGKLTLLDRPATNVQRKTRRE